jgi:ferritin-like metal-binding protein YciE
VLLFCQTPASPLCGPGQRRTLEEEKKTDAALNKLAASVVNQEARVA